MINFEKISDINSLALFLGCPVEEIKRLTSVNDQLIFYEEIRIPKKKRFGEIDYRVVYKTEEIPLKNIHKITDTAIKEKSNYKALPDYVQAFIPGRSTRTNALKHLAKKVILKIDIENFFDSITLEQIKKVFLDLGCNDNIAYYFSRLCSINNILSQGLNSSPSISNLACKSLDIELNRLSEINKCNYSRYADDITFSSEGKLPSLGEVESVLNSNGFRLNKNKTKIQTRGQYQYVTGLTVFDNVSPRVPKKYKRKLRLFLYYINKYGLSDFYERTFTHNVLGMVSYVNSVEPELGKKMFCVFNDVKNK